MSESEWTSRWPRIVGISAIAFAGIFGIIAVVLLWIPTFSSGIFNCKTGSDMYKSSIEDSFQEKGPNKGGLTQLQLERIEEILEFEDGLEGTAYGKCHAYCSKVTCFRPATLNCNPICTSFSECISNCDQCAMHSLGIQGAPSAQGAQSTPGVPNANENSSLPLLSLLKQAIQCIPAQDCGRFGFSQNR